MKIKSILQTYELTSQQKEVYERMIKYAKINDCETATIGNKGLFIEYKNNTYFIANTEVDIFDIYNYMWHANIDKFDFQNKRGDMFLITEEVVNKQKKLGPFMGLFNSGGIENFIIELGLANNRLTSEEKRKVLNEMGLELRLLKYPPIGLGRPSLELKNKYNKEEYLLI